MAKRVLTIVSCDKCGAEVEEPAIHVLSIDQRRRQLELCADDAKALVESTAPWLELGVPQQGVSSENTCRVTTAAGHVCNRPTKARVGTELVCGRHARSARERGQQVRDL